VESYSEEEEKVEE